MKARSKVDQRVTGGPDPGRSTEQEAQDSAVAVIASASLRRRRREPPSGNGTVFPNDPRSTASRSAPAPAALTSGAPFAAFIYQNVPSFELNNGDTSPLTRTP